MHETVTGTGKVDTPRPWLRRSTALLGGAVIAASLWGCGGDTQDAAPVVTPANQRDWEDEQPTIRLTLDPRVQFPESRYPTEQELATAVADLATAIVNGDDSTFERLLDRPARAVLRDLLDRGEWQSATSGIEVVRVCALTHDGGTAKVGLGVQDAAGAYLLGWEGTRSGGQWMFKGFPVEAREARRAQDLDGVTLTTAPAPVAAPMPTEPEPPAERTPPRPPSQPSDPQPSDPGEGPRRLPG